MGFPAPATDSPALASLEWTDFDDLPEDIEPVVPPRDHPVGFGEAHVLASTPDGFYLQVWNNTLPPRVVLGTVPDSDGLALTVEIFPSEARDGEDLLEAWFIHATTTADATSTRIVSVVDHRVSKSADTTGLDEWQARRIAAPGVTAGVFLPGQHIERSRVVRRGLHPAGATRSHPGSPPSRGRPEDTHRSQGSRYEERAGFVTDLYADQGHEAAVAVRE